MKKNTKLDDAFKRLTGQLPPKELSPIAMSFTLSEKQLKDFKAWDAKLPKKLKKIRYEEWFMFSGSSGIGLAIKIRREYANGEIREVDVTDVSEW